MRALVTGASGFIGSTLIEELNTLGFEVHALMRRSSAPNLEGLQYKIIQGDLSDADSLKRAVKDVDYVFHLAGAVTAPNRDAFMECNAEGTRRLAEAVAEVQPGLTRFVYVSSLAAAGPALTLSTPRTESDPDSPVSAYGESKLQGERELLKFKNLYPVTVIRPPIVYGPKDRGIFVAIKTVAKNFMPVLGQKYYSLIHVRDLCRGVVQAGVVERGKVPSGEIFFMSGDGIHSYEEMLGTIAEKLECDPIRFKVPSFAMTVAAASLTAVGKIRKKTFPLNLDKLRELKPDFWICSNRKAKESLGFAPEYDLSTGMSHAIEWYKRQKWL